ncbi:MAG: hypothetical protein A3E07_02195 [Candidatus Wildermuthbacteria bacterium RIFCSPHIGHO2_12_FULL_45_9]|uniref:Rod shape-determining protein RodA n=1 Tax=Candidatus Wildermuthbacteria bacterium RIFCSPHIGHO2_02_FULL_45_25 TaxID=1802450 RepID=A0A1G2R3R0_9BACT|nr:MAG: hypothetical protein A2748_01485 [Candidatus Wildermuthbacteria bacterium RIFCSPHIGHO2_01_FULL_45_20]OHA66882.1 MAG: hypothetical protein A3C04_02470 [Candidatus Wildermuthbacteria bacterium RIFCSPHIGHO2_02_FULL_45_25]OHA72095.1 MAG: hypothetical protein A3E07_02195 [Candidatus Wildermuthbacteria bacterium RIFCSPHIGHO2_12_FULL_45_9]
MLKAYIMTDFFSHIRRLDLILLGPAIILSVFGMISLWSSSSALGDYANLQKQGIFFGVALISMLLVSLGDYRFLRNSSYFILTLYFIGILALVGLLFFAPETRGIRAWYKIGPISIDPIEYMKIVMLILMAKFFTFRHTEVYRLRHLALSGVYFAIPSAFIAIQPNLGPVIILGGVWLLMLLVAGIKIKHLFAILLLGFVIGIFVWSFALHDYQKDRLLAFMKPELDPLGIGWSQQQAELAIGNGGIWGKGFGNGSQTQYGFLSEPQTDFIFAAIAEEFGLVAIVFLLGVLLVFFWRLIHISLRVEGNFARLFIGGFAVLFAMEVFINIGMNLGFLPIIGLPLPFVSYGGSSLIFTYIGLGIVQSIKTH